MMLLATVAIIIGLAVLVWSADTFIEGATILAVKFNMPSFLIGVLILGVGTSAPEMLVSMLSALAGSPGIALGNAYGSNIINIALVLGATALISPILIRGSVVKQDLPLLLLVTAIAAWQLLDGYLSRTDGIVLLLSLLTVLGLQVFLALSQQKQDKQKAAKSEPLDDVLAEGGIEVDPTTSTTKAFLTLIIGLTLLIVSSRSIVWGAVELATLWGLSELIVGLTIVAIGTSLPELVASVVAARRGEDDMALGNIVGSNLFNTLGVVGLAAVISPMSVDKDILSRDLPVMLAITVLLFVLCVLAYLRKGYLQRTGGALLLLSFISYTAWLIYTLSA